MMEAIAISLLTALDLLVEREHRKTQRRRREERAVAAAHEFLARGSRADSPSSLRGIDR
jgi:hypothetical protein